MMIFKDKFSEKKLIIFIWKYMKPRILFLFMVTILFQKNWLLYCPIVQTIYPQTHPASFNCKLSQS